VRQKAGLGAVAPPAAIANAIADALAPFGAGFNTTPIKPEQIVKQGTRRPAAIVGYIPLHGPLR
jgi:hypothetical protein